MNNTSLQQEIGQVSKVIFTGSLRMAKEIWSKKQETVYHSSAPGNESWSGKKFMILSVSLLNVKINDWKELFHGMIR